MPKTLTLRKLLAQGYFPTGLPPPFNSLLYGHSVAANPAKYAALFDPIGATKSASVTTFSYKRVGALRRLFGIPNPVFFYRHAKIISTQWSSIHKCYSRSKYSLSAPIVSNGPRSIEYRSNKAERLAAYARLRAKGRVALHADIARFFPSIYTHSIPWGILGKKHVKSIRHTPAFLSGWENRFDKTLRDCQEQQTNGIPIGPDSSHITAELILSAIDQQLYTQTKATGARVVDDYEFVFETKAEAEECLTVLGQLLNQYHLELNPDKTKIKELPFDLEAVWLSPLRQFSFRKGRDSQRNDLIAYADLAFRYHNRFPTDYVLKYAVVRLRRVQIDSSNWSLFQDLLAQIVRIEPSTLEGVIDLLFRAALTQLYVPDLSHWRSVLSAQILLNAPLGQTSEVSWALWASIAFELELDRHAIRAACRMEDSVVGLLCLHAKSLGLTRTHYTDITHKLMAAPAERYGPHWLFAYEAAVKAWLPGASLAGDANLSALAADGVSFYDADATAGYLSIFSAENVEEPEDEDAYPDLPF